MSLAALLGYLLFPLCSGVEPHEDASHKPYGWHQLHPAESRSHTERRSLSNYWQYITTKHRRQAGVSLYFTITCGPAVLMNIVITMARDRVLPPLLYEGVDWHGAKVVTVVCIRTVHVLK